MKCIGLYSNLCSTTLASMVEVQVQEAKACDRACDTVDTGHDSELASGNQLYSPRRHCDLVTPKMEGSHRRT